MLIFSYIPDDEYLAIMTAVTFIASVTPFGSMATCLAITICCLLASGIAGFGIYSTRGSTMTCPLIWSIVALWAVAGAEWYVWSNATEVGEGHWATSLRFFVATLTFCPAMAVLGAKRPQDWAWQFIVFSLWLVLILPAGEALLLRRSGLIEIHDARAVFLAGLIALGTLNYLPTRHCLSALLVGVGQALLLAGNLPGIRHDLGATGVLSFAVLVLLASLWTLRRTKVPEGKRFQADPAWRTFRDWYGAMWGLRVVQSLVSASEMYQWPVTLSWSGFFEIEREAPQENGEIELALQTTLRGQLRRFMSPQWISKNLPGSDES